MSKPKHILSRSGPFDQQSLMSDTHSDDAFNISTSLLMKCCNEMFHCIQGVVLQIILYGSILLDARAFGNNTKNNYRVTANRLFG